MVHCTGDHNEVFTRLEYHSEVGVVSQFLGGFLLKSFLLSRLFRGVRLSLAKWEFYHMVIALEVTAPFGWHYVVSWQVALNQRWWGCHDRREPLSAVGGS